jgi:hypothetical protein
VACGSLSLLVFWAKFFQPASRHSPAFVGVAMWCCVVLPGVMAATKLDRRKLDRRAC